MINIEFFKQLYQFCDDAGFVEIRKLPARIQDYVPVANIESINNICTELDQNQYFGVALRDGKGGTKQNITQIPACWVDIDFKDIPKEIVHEKLKQFPFQPTTIIKSGHGIHCYFLLKEPGTQEDIENIEEVNKRIAAALSGDANACDASRILRIPGTMNIKREPHIECKVVVENDFLYTVEDFLDILPTVKQPKNASVLPQTEQAQNWLVEAMEGVAEGCRETTATKIAGYWINKVSPNDVLAILKTWNMNNSPPLDEKTILSTVKSVSRYEPEKQKDDLLGNVYNAERMIQEYQNYVKSLGNNRFITGVKEIDKRIRGVAGGEVLTIIARAGSFKTAMLQNLIKNYLKHSAWGAVFFSIEMPVASITERYFQISDGNTGREVEDTFKKNLVGKNEAINDFKKDYKNLYVIPTKITLNDIPTYIKLIEKTYGLKIGVIGIDYIGLVEQKGMNSYETMSRVAKGLKSTAKLINLPVVALGQTSRAGKSGTTEITLSMGRDSGAIEEAADFVFGLWKIDIKIDEFGETEKGLVCKILKNRKGEEGSMWELDIVPKTLQIKNTATKYEPPQKKTKGF